MKTKHLIIGAVAALLLFLAYCKKQGKTPGEVVNGLFGKKDGEGAKAGNSQDTGVEDNGTEASAGAATGKVEDLAPYLPGYRITSRQNLSAGVASGTWPYAVIYVNGAKKKQFGFVTNTGRVNVLKQACENFVTEVRSAPADFDQTLIDKFKTFSDNEMRFCWHYIHQMGYTMTDKNGDEYILDSFSEIADDPVQNCRKNASGYIVLISKYRDFDDEL